MQGALVCLTSLVQVEPKQRRPFNRLYLDAQIYENGLAAELGRLELNEAKWSKVAQTVSCSGPEPT